MVPLPLNSGVRPPRLKTLNLTFDPETVIVFQSSASATNWLPTAAAFVAAAVAPFAAMYGPRMQLRIARAQKVSEARLQWISQLRTQTAAYIARITELRSIRARSPFDASAANEALHAALEQGVVIRLMLDRSKSRHTRLDSAVTAAMGLFTDEKTGGGYGVVMNELHDAASALLDEAWERVKTGN